MCFWINHVGDWMARGKWGSDLDLVGGSQVLWCVTLAQSSRGLYLRNVSSVQNLSRDLGNVEVGGGVGCGHVWGEAITGGVTGFCPRGEISWIFFGSSEFNGRRAGYFHRFLQKSPGGAGSVAPLGLDPEEDGNPRLTRWAIVFRPSGPGAGALRSDAGYPHPRRSRRLGVKKTSVPCAASREAKTRMGKGP